MNNLFGLFRLMRPHQWVKNAFVFTGLLFGHAWHDPNLTTQVIFAFVAFCLVSSTIYIVNDIIDLEQDRHHPKKHQRPLVSGQVSVFAAMLLATVLGALGFGLAYGASKIVVVILVAYALMNIPYSFWLKHVVI